MDSFLSPQMIQFLHWFCHVKHQPSKQISSSPLWWHGDADARVNQCHLSGMVCKFAATTPRNIIIISSSSIIISIIIIIIMIIIIIIMNYVSEHLATNARLKLDHQSIINELVSSSNNTPSIPSCIICLAVLAGIADLGNQDLWRFSNTHPATWNALQPWPKIINLFGGFNSFNKFSKILCIPIRHSPQTRVKINNTWNQEQGTTRWTKHLSTSRYYGRLLGSLTTRWVATLLKHCGAVGRWKWIINSQVSQGAGGLQGGGKCACSYFLDNHTEP